MRGCLSLPFRLLALALLVLGGFVAWSYRGEIRRRIHDWTASPASEQSGGPGDAARAPDVFRKLEGLGGGRDSVVLGASEVAHLLAAGAEARLPRALDSIEVRLGQDDIDVRARLDTRRVTLSFGPLTGVVKDYERLEAGGPLLFRRARLAEWEVVRVRVRGIPLPRDVIGRLLRAGGAGEDNLLAVPLPSSVGGLRVTATGLVLYPAASRGAAP